MGTAGQVRPCRSGKTPTFDAKSLMAGDLHFERLATLEDKRCKLST